jgi:hypothetical protein
MAGEAPPPIRSIITDDEFGGFRVTVPPAMQNSCGLGCGIAIVYIVFAACLLGLITDLRSHHVHPDSRRFLVLLVLGMIAFTGMLVTGLTRREVLMIDGKTLSIWTERVGVRASDTFDLSEIGNLKPVTPFVLSKYKPGRGPAITFDHNGKSYLFGFGLSEYEGKRIAKTIHLRYPIPDEGDDDVEPLPVET